MKTYICQCGARLHFENTLCVSCQHKLGFLPDERKLSALQAEDKTYWKATLNGRRYRKCKNYQQHNVCNWMVPENEDHAFCLSCRLTEIIPDLSKPDNIPLFRRIERAKRRLIYSLLWLDMPIVSKKQDAKHGLAFRLMEDKGYSEFANTDKKAEPVMTGHKSGTITLNIAEADPVAREQTRADLEERYRTLLGHFRHESGHYYWSQLVRDTPRIDAFRTLFGDERVDYARAMKEYYATGPQAKWQTNWISAYACSHPWEDWAETWAHYLHMIDTLETASDYGFDLGVPRSATNSRPYFSAQYLFSLTIDDLVSEWVNITVALNDLNRSMGLVDAYPFILSPTITRKLDFVHALVTKRNA